MRLIIFFCNVTYRFTISIFYLSLEKNMHFKSNKKIYLDTINMQNAMHTNILEIIFNGLFARISCNKNEKKTANTLSNSNYILYILAVNKFLWEIICKNVHMVLFHICRMPYYANVADTKAINNQQIIEISKKRFGKPHILKYVSHLLLNICAYL